MGVRFLMLLVLLLTCVSGKIEDCGSKKGSLLSASVSNCDNNKARSKCVLKKNTNVTIEIKFTNVDTKKITAKVYGILGDMIPIPFALPDNNGCNSGVVCPVKPQQTNTYKASLPVSKNYPSISVDVEWKLKDDKGEDFICLIIPSVIK